MITGKTFDPNVEVIGRTTEHIKMGPIYNLIPKWRYESYKRQYRPLNTRFIELITQNREVAEQFTYKERVNYKMGVYQLMNNINYISARYQLADIRGQTPTSMIKNKLLKFYR